MKQNDDIAKELQEVAPTLSKLDKINFHQVKDGYFQNSADSIMSLISKEKSPSVFSQIDKKELYAAPHAAYFEGFADAVTAKINAEEVAEELSYSAPHLFSLAKKEMPVVPANYFASFPEVMTQIAAHEDAAHHSEIEALSNRWAAVWEEVVGFFSRPVYALAVASCVSLILCAGLAVNNNSLSEEDKIFAQMQQIPVSDLNSYLSRHRDEYDEHTILHNINETDFTRYFDKPEDAPQHLIDQSKGSSDQDVNIDEIVD